VAIATFEMPGKGKGNCFTLLFIFTYEVKGSGRTRPRCTNTTSEEVICKRMAEML
jgi:hypothetical protein